MMVIFVLSWLFWLSIFLILYSYIAYPALLVWYSRSNRTFEPVFHSQLPGLSIVIAAYNEEKDIGARIENCLALDYPADRLEIIIASDGSDDRTSAIVQPYADAGKVRFFDFKERRGKVNVLNEVVPQATHDIVAFSDANTQFQLDAMKKLVRFFQNDEVGCVCGQLKFTNASGSKTGELEGVYWRYETLLKKLEGARGSLLGANGAIFAIRKALYVACPPDTIVEDLVVPMRILELGKKVIFDPEAIALEPAAYRIIHEKKRRIRIGAGDFQALLMLSHLLHPKYGFTAWAFWSHKVLRWFTPFFMMIAFMTNLSLIGYPVFRVLFILQCAFYVSAFVGQVLNWSGIQVRFFSLCYYFVSMNLALFLGFVKFITGTQRVTWNRTER